MTRACHVLVNVIPYYQTQTESESGRRADSNWRERYRPEAPGRGMLPSTRATVAAMVCITQGITTRASVVFHRFHTFHTFHTYTGWHMPTKQAERVASGTPASAPKRRRSKPGVRVGKLPATVVCDDVDDGTRCHRQARVMRAEGNYCVMHWTRRLYAGAGDKIKAEDKAQMARDLLKTNAPEYAKLVLRAARVAARRGVSAPSEWALLHSGAVKPAAKDAGPADNRVIVNIGVKLAGVAGSGETPIEIQSIPQEPPKELTP